MQLIMMTVAEGDALRSDSEGIHRLDPRPIEAGPYVGNCILPSSLLVDDRYADFHDALAGFPIIDVDLVEAFPPDES